MSNSNSPHLSQGETEPSCRALVLSKLDNFIETIRSGNWIKLRSYYSRRFKGQFLGLNHLRLDSDKDGVRIYHFQAASSDVCKRDKAVIEWSSYAAGFVESREITVHLDSLERADPCLVATICFEHIGRPFGAETLGVDRARFRIVMERAGELLRIVDQALIEGERILSDQPLLINVAKEAEIASKNQAAPEPQAQALNLKNFPSRAGGKQRPWFP